MDSGELIDEIGGTARDRTEIMPTSQVGGFADYPTAP